MRGASNWSELSRDKDFDRNSWHPSLVHEAAVQKVVQDLRSNADEEPPIVVSLGPGTGVEDAKHLVAIAGAWGIGSNSRPTHIWYSPYDISLELINTAVVEVYKQWVNQRLPLASLKIRAISADFYELNLQSTSSIPVAKPGQSRVLLFLGGTIGNLDDSHLLTRIWSQMRDSDWLLLGVDCIDPGVDDSELRRQYSRADRGLRFVAEPLFDIRREVPDAAGLDIPRCFDVGWARKRIAVDVEAEKSTVPAAKTVVHSVEERSTRSRIEISISHKYAANELYHYLETRFTIHDAWQASTLAPKFDRDKLVDYTVYSLTKKPADPTVPARPGDLRQRRKRATDKLDRWWELVKHLPGAPGELGPLREQAQKYLRDADDPVLAEVDDILNEVDTQEIGTYVAQLRRACEALTSK